MEDKRLLTLWLPLVLVDASTNGFTEEEGKFVKEYNNYEIIISKYGFVYIDIKSDIKIDEIYNEIYSLYNNNSKLKELLEKTLFNEDIGFTTKMEGNEEGIFKKFLKDITIEFKDKDNKTIDLDLKYIKYQLDKNQEKKFYKFNIMDESLNKKLLNRSFENLLKKSLVYTQGYTFEKEELIESDYINSKITKKLIKKIKLYIKEDNTRIINNRIIEDKIIKNIYKKALQDSIEEYTILHFLYKVKEKYLNKIIDKLDEVNTSLLYINTVTLNIEASKSASHNIMREDEVELYSQNLNYVIPFFDIIDNKIQDAYYINIGNTTTETGIENSETIENTFYYKQWFQSIEYFKNLSTKIENILSTYHQNKNIKELEHISYYESYKADLDDIKSIYTVNPLDEYKKTNKKDLALIALIVSLSMFALKTEFIDFNDILKFFEKWELLYDNILWVHKQIPYFSYEMFPLLGRLLIISSPFICYFMCTRIISYLKMLNSTNYYNFDIDDYDKHEHKSKQPIYTDKNNNILVIQYNENVSAYKLMSQLKKSKINERSIFPRLLRNDYEEAKNKKYTFRENYRISRDNKINIHMLFRFRIQDISLQNIIDFYDDKEEKRKEVEQNNKEEEKFKKFIEKYKNNKKIKLNLYIVYSFKLKKNISKTKKPQYAYDVYKDQFRVHYHINKLPIKNIEVQKYIAELIYRYFLKHLKYIKTPIKTN